MFRRVFKTIAFPSVLLLSHSTYVVYKRQQKLENVQFQKENPLASDFRIGTADDLVMDNLQTGDVIIFQRKWYQQHFPVAFLLIIYRYLYGCDYDHVGIVLTDKKGQTYVIENTLFRGVKCRLFSERILYSQAAIITLIPLSPRDLNLSPNALFRAQPELLAYPKEFSELSTACARKVLSLAQSSIKDDNRLICPNLRFLEFIYSHLGIDCKLGQNVTLQNLNNPSIPLHLMKRDAMEDKTQVNVKFDTETVQVRS